MTQTWKGGQYRDYAVHARTDICEAKGCKPVIVTPIEDESLPHPGDGKQWEDRYGEPVEVLSVPEWSEGDGAPTKLLSLVRNARTGGVEVIPTSHLRERQPDPEHRPWCKRKSIARTGQPPGPGYCWCGRDPRSGEERRKGQRRRYDPVGRFRDASGLGRRSGTDRRSS